MDKIYVSLILKPLLEAAVGGKVFEGVAALCKIRDKMEIAKEKMTPAVVEVDYPRALKALDSYIERLREAPPLNVIEYEAFKNEHIRKVIGELASHGFTDGVEYLFAADKNFSRRYDGDAARKLIAEVAFLLAEEVPHIGKELGRGIHWLSQQNDARHAFGPKDSRGRPLKGGQLSKSRLSKTEADAKKYGEYLAERRYLFCVEKGFDPDYYVLDDNEVDAADKLWRDREVERGIRRRTVDVRLSRWRTAFFKLTNLPS